MENLKKIDGKKLALVAWGEDEEGNDDVAVFSGIARVTETGIYFEKQEIDPIELRDEWLERIKRVPPHLKETLLDAEYVISLSVGNLSEESDTRDFEDTGLKWPK